MKHNNHHHMLQARTTVVRLWEAPGIRGALYLTTNAVLLEIASRLRDHQQPFSGERMHIALAPVVAAVATGFSRMSPKKSTAPVQVLHPRQFKRFATGAALGASAIAAALALAKACGWVSTTVWGWEHYSASSLAASIVYATLGHLAVAFNEETVFRGYGYETLEEAMPPVIAGGILTLLFGLGHGLEPQVVIGEMALGLPLLLLRVRTNGIAMAMGYHWAWNVIQTAVVAPVDATPSLLPIELHGPYLWLGRPGSPEPGLLTIITNSAVAVGLALLLIVQQQRAGNVTVV